MCLLNATLSVFSPSCVAVEDDLRVAEQPPSPNAATPIAGAGAGAAAGAGAGGGAASASASGSPTCAAVAIGDRVLRGTSLAGVVHGIKGVSSQQLVRMQTHTHGIEEHVVASLNVARTERVFMAPQATLTRAQRGVLIVEVVGCRGDALHGQSFLLKFEEVQKQAVRAAGTGRLRRCVHIAASNVSTRALSLRRRCTRPARAAQTPAAAMYASGALTSTTRGWRGSSRTTSPAQC
jgi:hypothetical protein